MKRKESVQLLHLIRPYLTFKIYVSMHGWPLEWIIMCYQFLNCNCSQSELKILNHKLTCGIFFLELEAFTVCMNCWSFDPVQPDLINRTEGKWQNKYFAPVFYLDETFLCKKTTFVTLFTTRYQLFSELLKYAIKSSN